MDHEEASKMWKEVKAYRVGIKSHLLGLSLNLDVQETTHLDRTIQSVLMLLFTIQYLLSDLKMGENRLTI